MIQVKRAARLSPAATRRSDAGGQDEARKRRRIQTGPRTTDFTGEAKPRSVRQRLSRCDGSHLPPVGLHFDKLGIGMADDGGKHDAADDQRPGGVPINPKHEPASVSISQACGTGVTEKRCARSLIRGAARPRGRTLFWFGRRRGAIGLAGVALCHDVLIALAFARARRRLGLAGLTAMLAAHVGLAFEIVFTGHAGSMRSRTIGSQPHRLFSPCVRTHGIAVLCSAG